MLIDTLRLGTSDDGDLVSRWRAARDDGLLELVVDQGAAIWLFRRLRAIGALDLMPPAIVDPLRQHAFADAAMRMEVEAEAAAVVGLLGQAGVPLVLIKGLARCALAERYNYLDARATFDVDLLVPQERIEDANASLRAAGYTAVLPAGHQSPVDHHHSPPLHRGRVTVELHTSTSTRVEPEVAWARAADRSELLQWCGQVVRVPAATELAWSAIAHAMEDAVAGFSLKRFLEVAALVSGGAHIDWEALRQRAATPEAFDPDAGVEDSALVIGNWVAAALVLVGVKMRPARPDLPEFDLSALLAWRMGVLQARPRLGRATSDRLLAEGGRTLVGLPPERSPEGASPVARIRRNVAGRVSRVAFRAWRATRRG